MTALPNQIAGLALLALGLWAAETVLQCRRPMAGWLRRARLLALAAATGGGVGAPAWWQDLPFAFAWDLPPLAARFLAAAGMAFAIAGFRAAMLGSTGHLRLIAAMLAAYLGPLGLAILAWHLDRFDFAATVTWAFFLIVALLLGGALASLIRLPAEPRGLSGSLLGLIGAVTLLWGLALFLWPAAPLPLIWPWPGDPLTSRLIAAMLLTVGLCCLMAEGPSERRTAHLFCLTYGTGIALASALALQAGTPAPPAYLVLWGLIAVASAAALIRGHAAGPTPGPSPRG